MHSLDQSEWRMVNTWVIIMSVLSTASINYELYSTAWSEETCPLKMTMFFIIVILLSGLLSGT